MPSVPLPPLPDGPVDVAVVVPARHAADALPATLAAIVAQDPAPTEVAVAVAPGDVDTRAAVLAVAAQHGSVRLVDNPTGRTPDGLNAAIAATSAPVVARVDAQAIVGPGYLATALQALRTTGAANVGGRQVPVAEGGFAAAVAAAMASPVGAGGAAYRTSDVAGPADTVYLGVFRRDALDDVGGYDPRFTRNQDAELNLRLARAGHLVWYEPALRVAYTPRGTVGALASQYLQYGRWRRLTATIHRGSLAPRQLAAPALVAGLAAGAGLAATGRPQPLAALAATYLAAVGAGAVHAAGEPRQAPATAVALATMHLSWGVGFWLGPPRDPDR